uniref:Sulfotransferase domain-containing protein n=5 Tax=Photinus pyralis TaxID=7054 RepID=A0A1Y1M845_PHOPY
MKKNLKSEIVRVSQFLEEKPLTDDELTLIGRRLDFNFMKNNPSVNHQCFSDEMKRKNHQLEGDFMKSGSVGGYKREMTDEMVQKFDRWIEENITDTELYEKYWFGA